MVATVDRMSGYELTDADRALIGELAGGALAPGRRPGPDPDPPLWLPTASGSRYFPPGRPRPRGRRSMQRLAAPG